MTVRRTHFAPILAAVHSILRTKCARTDHNSVFARRAPFSAISAKYLIQNEDPRAVDRERHAGQPLAFLRHAMNSSSNGQARRKAVWGPKRTLGAALLLVAGVASNAAAAGNLLRTAPLAKPASPNAFTSHNKLDKSLTDRSQHGPANDTTPVVVTFTDGNLPADFKPFVTPRNRKLAIVNGYALDLPNRLLVTLASNPNVVQFHVDRPLRKQNLITGLTTGARAIQSALGLTGAGVGVAIIDSGVASWHDDLTNRSTHIYTYGNQR